MLKQERSHNKKIESNRGDPVDDWRKGQVEKLQKQVIEAERMVRTFIAHLFSRDLRIMKPFFFLRTSSSNH